MPPARKATKRVVKKATRERVPAKKAAPRMAKAPETLESFKQRLIEHTKNYPSGCTSGKRDFLEGLDLNMDGDLGGTYTVTFKLAIDPDNFYDDFDDKDDLMSNISEWANHWLDYNQFQDCEHFEVQVTKDES